MLYKLAIWGAPGCGKSTYLNNIIKKFNKDYIPSILTTYRRETADHLSNTINMTHSYINTIHGICYDLLGGKSSNRVVEAKDIREFERLTGLSLKKGRNNSSIHNLIDWLVNTDERDITKYPLISDIGIDLRTIDETIKEWKNYKEENNLIDYSDMLLEVVKKKLLPHVNVLIVDEFQDISFIQNKIIEMWSLRMSDVVIAGDPLQSIYGFQGGSPDFFQDFDGERITLPHSYRLPAQIWDPAKELVTSYDMEVPEITTKETTGKIIHMSYRNYVSNAERLEGKEGNEVYHLVRANYQANEIAKTFYNYGIVFQGLHGWEKMDINLLNAIIKIRNNRMRFTPNQIRALQNQYHSKWLLKGRGTLLGIDKKQSIISPELIAHIRFSEPVGNPKYSKRTEKLRDIMLNNAIKRHNAPVKQESIKTHLMTIHASKGLEADTVFLHTGITNRIKKAMRNEPSAEARVFYVGMTRAKKNLVLVKSNGKNFRIAS